MEPEEAGNQILLSASDVRREFSELDFQIFIF